MRILIAGGGTGGHLFPGLAIAEKIKLHRKSADITFVGTKRGIEGKIVPDKGYRFHQIWIGGLSRGTNILMTALKNPLFLLKLLVSMAQSFLLLRRIKPDIVVGTGGFVSGPPLFVASLLGYTTIIHEQNSYPGLTTRLLASRVNRVHLSYKQSLKYLKPGGVDYRVSGNPVRPELVRRAKTLNHKAYDLDEDKRTILIFGGSQGATPINEHFLDNIEVYANRNDLQILWQTGSADLPRIIAKVGVRPNVRILPFLTDMAGAYASSDLAICRAGAVTLAELATVALPAILIPLPHAAENHQLHNARLYVEAGAALIIEQSNLPDGILEKVALKLVYDTQKLGEMSRAYAPLAPGGAADAIVDSIFEMVN